MTINYRTLLCSALFTSLCISSIARADLTEPETKHTFASKIADGGGDLRITGVGDRTKFGFDVYAVGLYIDKAGGQAALKNVANGGKIDVEKSKGDMKLYNAILDCKCTRAIWIKMARTVGGAKIKDGFMESMGKNIDIESADLKADLEKLSTFLTSAEASKNSEFKFVFGADGSLTGKGPGGNLAITNAKLARGFLSIWIGTSPITPKLRANLITEVNTILE